MTLFLGPISGSQLGYQRDAVYSSDALASGQSSPSESHTAAQHSMHRMNLVTQKYESALQDFMR